MSIDKEGLGQTIQTLARKSNRALLEAEGQQHTAFSRLAQALDRWLGNTSVHKLEGKSYGDRFSLSLGTFTVILERLPIRMVKGRGFVGPIKLALELMSTKKATDLCEFVVVGDKVYARNSELEETEDAYVDHAFKVLHKFLKGF